MNTRAVLPVVTLALVVAFTGACATVSDQQVMNGNGTDAVARATLAPTLPAPKLSDEAIAELLVAKSPWNGRWLSVTAITGDVYLKFYWENGRLSADFESWQVESLTLNNGVIHFQGRAIVGSYHYTLSVTLQLDTKGGLEGKWFSSSGRFSRLWFSPQQ